MFGSIGGAELVLLLVLALLVFGPRKLPGIGRTVGRGLSEFRKATTDFRMNLEREVDLDQLHSVRREVTESVNQIRSLGVERGAIPPGAPKSPAEPAAPATSGNAAAKSSAISDDSAPEETPAPAEPSTTGSDGDPGRNP